MGFVEPRGVSTYIGKHVAINRPDRKRGKRTGKCPSIQIHRNREFAGLMCESKCCVTCTELREGRCKMACPFIRREQIGNG